MQRSLLFLSKDQCAWIDRPAFYAVLASLSVAAAPSQRCSERSSRMQALKCPGEISRNRGGSSAQAGKAYRHRVRKAQPDGGARGLGMSPTSTMRWRFTLGSATGAAENT